MGAYLRQRVLLALHPPIRRAERMIYCKEKQIVDATIELFVLPIDRSRFSVYKHYLLLLFCERSIPYLTVLEQSYGSLHEYLYCLLSYLKKLNLQFL